MASEGAPASSLFGRIPDDVFAGVLVHLDYLSEGRALQRVSKRMRAIARDFAWHPDPERPLELPSRTDKALDLVLDVTSGRVRAIRSVGADEIRCPHAPLVLAAMKRSGLRPRFVHLRHRSVDAFERLYASCANALDGVERLAIEFDEDRENYDEYFESVPEVLVASHLPAIREIDVLLRRPIRLADFADFAARAERLARLRIIAVPQSYTGDEDDDDGGGGETEVEDSGQRYEEHVVRSAFELESFVGFRMDERHARYPTWGRAWEEAVRLLRTGAAAPEAGAAFDARFLVAVARGGSLASERERDIGGLVRWIEERALQEGGLTLATSGLRPTDAARCIRAAGGSLVAYWHEDVVRLTDPGIAIEIDALVDASKRGAVRELRLVYSAPVEGMAARLAELLAVRNVVLGSPRCRANITFLLSDMDDVSGDDTDHLKRRLESLFGIPSGNHWLSVAVFGNRIRF